MRASRRIWMGVIRPQSRWKRGQNDSNVVDRHSGESRNPGFPGGSGPRRLPWTTIRGSPGWRC